MADNAGMRERIANDVLSELPPALGFDCFRVCDVEFRLRTEKCVIQLLFERYEVTGCNFLIVDPQKDPQHRNGMSLIVLLHMRGISGPTHPVPYSFRTAGRTLSEHFGDLLSGDFSRFADYERMEQRIFDRMFEAMALPLGHPTRTRFENFDIRWLDDLESDKS